MSEPEKPPSETMRAGPSSEASRSSQSVQLDLDTPTGLESSCDDAERLRRIKAFVDKAVKMHKVFCVQGRYPVVRAALQARGWVERRMPLLKRHTHRCQKGEGVANLKAPVDGNDNNSDDAEAEEDSDGVYDLMSRLVKNEMVYFYWTRSRNVICKNTNKDQMVNYFVRTDSFTTKVGLCVNLRNLNWFDSADPNTFFPRCYVVGKQDEKDAFIEDYRRTACTSLLMYIVEKEMEKRSRGEAPRHNINGQRKQGKQQPGPMVLSQMISTALKVCQEFLMCLDHQDIDKNLDTAQTLTNQEWTEFINSYQHVVHHGVDIEISDDLVTYCKAIIQRLKEVNPQLGIDGILNMWIVKPGALSRGRGIKCIKDLDQILKLVSGKPKLITESKWVVQKYLERPFLIHGTKFDVRQWFLVTDWHPLTVWFYKKCYLRFSTQPYSLDTLKRSVHLCNNSIQRHLRPSEYRNQDIPEDNMWSDDQFRDFLVQQNQQSQWDTVIIPGMKKIVIHALQTTQELVESRKNSFELFGADFILAHDLHPWLIEINAVPTMAQSSTVTARLCRAVQEDILRVVLDHRADRKADTGDFELIYKQAKVEFPRHVGFHALVEGVHIKRPSTFPQMKSSCCPAPKHCGPVSDKQPTADATKHLPSILLRDAETKVQTISTESPICPLPPGNPKPLRTGTVRCQLPVTLKKCDFPFTEQPLSEILEKKRDQRCQKSPQRKMKKKHQTPSLPLKIHV
ncbi:uncharacterized protein V6R79_020457 [Siganus canaliculatus]